jgi:hypothetical protein
VRLPRAELKRGAATAQVDPVEVVLACPWMVESMQLAELLVCQPHWGRTRCRAFLKPLSLGESKTLGSLTERQRVTSRPCSPRSGTGKPAFPPQRVIGPPAVTRRLAGDPAPEPQ